MTHELTPEEIAELTAWAKALGVTVEPVCLNEEPFVEAYIAVRPDESLEDVLNDPYRAPAWIERPSNMTPDVAEDTAWRAVAQWLATPNGAMWGLGRTREVLATEDTIRYEHDPRCTANPHKVRFERTGKFRYSVAVTFGLAMCRACRSALIAAGKVTP